MRLFNQGELPEHGYLVGVYLSYCRRRNENFKFNVKIAIILVPNIFMHLIAVTLANIIVK